MKKTMPTKQIHFGPADKEWPPEVQKLFKDANQKAHALFMAAYNGPHHKESVDRLVELGRLVCQQIEVLWRNPRFRADLEAVASESSFFPLLHTNLIETPWSCGDEMKGKLRLQSAPGNEKGKKGGKKPGAKVKDDLLTREVEIFVLGVLNTGTLRVGPMFQNKDVIDRGTRRRLLSRTGRKNLGAWSTAFIERYIRPLRPDLLTDDGESGTFSMMTKERFSEFQLKNPNEKNWDSKPWRAFKSLVSERLRKFRPMIRSTIRTN